MSKELEAREKFDYFIIGLCFAILGASIQTAHFNPMQKIAGLLEIIAWVCFVVSAVLGILRLKTYELYFALFRLQESISSKQSKLNEMLERVNRSREKAITKENSILTFSADTLEDEIIALSNENKTAFTLNAELTLRVDNFSQEKYYTILIVAIIVLALARSIEPIKQLIRVVVY